MLNFVVNYFTCVTIVLFFGQPRFRLDPVFVYISLYTISIGSLLTDSSLDYVDEAQLFLSLIVPQPTIFNYLLLFLAIFNLRWLV